MRHAFVDIADKTMCSRCGNEVFSVEEVCPAISDGKIYAMANPPDLYNGMSTQQRSERMEWRLLSEITAADLVDQKALVWARVKLFPYADSLAFEPYWSDWTVWKALWYPHKGPMTQQQHWLPSYQPIDGNAGYMQITHFMKIPDSPADWSAPK